MGDQAPHMPLSPQSLSLFAEQFHLYDRDGSGFVDLANYLSMARELDEYYKKGTGSCFGFSQESAMKEFGERDTNSDGKITLEEWMIRSDKDAQGLDESELIDLMRESVADMKKSQKCSQARAPPCVDVVQSYELFKVAPRWVFLRIETRNNFVG